MVLPEPAAHDPPDQAVGWLDEVALSLRLSRAAALVLIDHARPSLLGDLVRTLRHDWPGLEVVPSVDGLTAVPAGSTLVLTPTAGDAAWLNQRRAQFSERSLKVVLFCDHATTLALKFQAPDFYDWIGRHKDCPKGPVPFAVHGIRAAFEAKWPVVWTGSRERGVVEDVVRAAMPGADVVWLKGNLPFEEMVKALGSGGGIVVDVRTARQLRRVRWARAAAERDSRPKVVIVAGNLECPGYFPVHEGQMLLSEACSKLAAAGAKAPGLLAALFDLEPEAIELAETLLKNGMKEDALLGAAADLDPGASLARLGLPRGDATSWEKVFLKPSPPRMRGLAKQPRIRAAFERWQTQAANSWGMRVPSEMDPMWAVHGRTAEGIGRGVHACFAEMLGNSLERQWGVEWFLKPESLERSVLGSSKRDGYRLELASAAAALGEGDVVAFVLGGVETPDLKRLLTPHIPRIAAETSAQAILEVFHIVAQDLHAEQTAKAKVTYKRKTARLKGVFGAFAVGLAAMAVAFQLYGFRSGVGLAGGGSVACFLLVLLLGRAGRPPPVERHWAEWPLLRVLERQANAELQTRSDIQKATQFSTHGDPREAELLLLSALTDAKTHLGPDHPVAHAASVALATFHLTHGNREKALQAIQSQLAGDDASLPTESLLFIARLLSETGRAADATRALLHLLETTLPTQANLRPEGGLHPEDDIIVQRLLSQPAGRLSDEPNAHLTLVDALVKQGRYPEALLLARGASTKFEASLDKDAVELRVRTADLTRRLGDVAP